VADEHVCADISSADVSRLSTHTNRHIEDGIDEMELSG